MRLAISTFIRVLATAASTVATVDLDWKTNGTIIPLIKRKSDNNVDFDALPYHVESVDAKILRGFEIYERNTGTSHSLAMKGAREELLNLRNRAVGAAALTTHHEFEDDSVWFATIAIGTPPKSFTVEIDTGSSDLFVPGLDCSGCSQQIRWDPTSSSTAEYNGRTFNIRFADGVTASGRQYTDNVTIAGLTADIQTLGAATVYSTDFGFPPDGVLGMAFQSISSYPASSVIETLVDERKLNEPVFSVKLTSDGGELYLGGTNGDLFQGGIIYTPVTVLGYWQVEIKTIRGNHQTILRNIPAIIDTGATVIVGDRSEVANLHSTLGGKRADHGYYSFPCNNFPTISFDFGGGRTFRIPASTLNMGPVRTGSPDCFSGIYARAGRGYWSIGAIFLKSVYTVFDFGNNQVGFAKLV